MTLEQVQWAKQHDWFVTGTPDINSYHSIIVQEPGQEPIEFTDFQKLKEWAGY